MDRVRPARPEQRNPRIERLEILPQNAVLKAGTNQQLIVRGAFLGRKRAGLTRWARYTSAVASVAVVDDFGRVSIMGTGEGAISAWYLSRIGHRHRERTEQKTAAARNLHAGQTPANFIDELCSKIAEFSTVPPSPRCNDSGISARVFIDTIGVAAECRRNARVSRRHERTSR